MTNNVDGKVFVVKVDDRKYGLRTVLDQFHIDEYSGKKVALKANYNSADPFPASTHSDTLEALVSQLREAGAKELTFAERSGMGNTRDVLMQTGVLELSRRLGFKVVVLDELGREGWVKIEKKGTHWLRGFFIPKIFLEADKVVQTCCLKTHRFGGHFTISLKNSVGLVAKKVPGGLYDYMWELHESPYQRLMIAEINRYYNVDLVVMDALRAFVNKGPEEGDIVEPNLILASRDRIAMDAVGVAILRSYGSTENVMRGRIFELDQIRRAADLGVGVKSASEMELVSLNKESQSITKKLQDILKREGKEGHKQCSFLT